MASHGIEIKDLFKLSGPRRHKYVDTVMGGMSKTELNEKHGHVLGL